MSAKHPLVAKLRYVVELCHASPATWHEDLLWEASDEIERLDNAISNIAGRMRGGDVTWQQVAEEVEAALKHRPAAPRHTGVEFTPIDRLNASLSIGEG